MKSRLASGLLTVAIVATILPPGYPAYIGAYTGLVAALLALLVYGWPERAAFAHPTARAILAAIVLVSITVPFVYQGDEDLLAPVLILPMLTAIVLGLLARPASWIPGPTSFALLCLVAAFVAMAGGAYEYFVLGIYRPGLGNNPIHYGSLAVMAGCLAMTGIVASSSPWRYGFFLGPIFALGAAVIADSRGPMVSVVVTAGIGTLVLLAWLWHEKLFRFALLAAIAAATASFLYLVGSGNSRVAGILDSGLNIFRFTGGSDDTRAALYASAVESLRDSPMFGQGLSRILLAGETMFPELLAASNFDNLHADWANFAAMAGALGLLAWILLLVAPLLLLLDPVARRDRPIMLGAVLLSIGQLTLGASNATFGLLPQTMCYAVPLGYLLCRARRLALEAKSAQRPRVPAAAG